ncbi:MAG: lysophospholipid acyltransferase family protein [Thermodesulfobacteriota bacterium]
MGILAGPGQWVGSRPAVGKREEPADRLKAKLKFKDLSTFFQLPFNVWLFKNMPAWVSRMYLGLLSRLYFRLAAKERGAIQASLAHCLGLRMGSRKAQLLWSRVRDGIVEHYHEKLFLAFKSFRCIRRVCLRRVSVANQHILDQAVAQGRGVILVTGHYGALEFLPGALAFRGFPLSVMVHCKTPKLKKILEERANRTRTELLDPKSGEVFFQALDHLKRGRVVITQCDEIDMWRPYKDKTINFLGLNVPLDRSMDILARKSKAVVVMGLVHRLGCGRYQVELRQPQTHPAARGAALVSQQCLSVLSSYIYSRPHEWYEWKKLRPFVDANLESRANENSGAQGLFNRVAFHLGGVPQPG